MALLIDGFNLLYKFSDLEEMMYCNELSDARRGLLEKLKKYVQITGTRIRVVFDGKKEMFLNIRSERVGKIDVYYSLDYSADFLIKEFIKKDLNPQMATVITSDKDIISYVTHFKAKVKKSEDFAKQLNETIEKWQETVIPEKDENPIISNDEISYWENLFKEGSQ